MYKIKLLDKSMRFGVVGGLICVLLGGRDLGVLYFWDEWR